MKVKITGLDAIRKSRLTGKELQTMLSQLFPKRYTAADIQSELETLQTRLKNSLTVETADNGEASLKTDTKNNRIRRQKRRKSQWKK